jgi:hypothetical protein
MAFESSAGRHKRSVTPLDERVRAFSALHSSTRGDRMPDYEIRYYRADGTLALIQITVQPNERHAHEHALRHQGDHARFDLRSLHGASSRS